MLCAIWYHLKNFKNVKNTHGGALILLKLLQVNDKDSTQQCEANKGLPRVFTVKRE